jgi:hypothetical protein
MNRVQSPPESFVKNVTNSGSAAQFRCLDVSRRPFDRGAVSGGKFRDDLEQSFALIGNIFTVRVKERLELGHHQIDARLKIIFQLQLG